ncbi:MAG TPA: OB-fold domain-containing protein [Burkholderiaceae bacterium]|nr:OB-fold domain-containing protein [Burkholderiaceae bacterium]
MEANSEMSPLATFRQYLSQGRLAYQRDRDGRAVFYPRVVAPGSGGALSWEISKGYGHVYSTTTVFPREGAPYNVSLIDLDEGFRLMSRVEGLNPDAVRIGMRVRMRVLESEDAPPYPVFDPVGPQ